METRLATLSIREALEEAGMRDCGYLPKLIGFSGKALILSDQRGCYFSVTIHSCSCDESISGISPCSHQIYAFPSKFMQVKPCSNEYDNKTISLDKEHRKKEREEIQKSLPIIKVSPAIADIPIIEANLDGEEEKRRHFLEQYREEKYGNLD